MQSNQIIGEALPVDGVIKRPDVVDVLDDDVAGDEVGADAAVVHEGYLGVVPLALRDRVGQHVSNVALGSSVPIVITVCTACKT